MKIYKSRDKTNLIKTGEMCEVKGERKGGRNRRRCMWMLSVSHVIYHQDRYRYGALASQPHYTFTLLLKHSHTSTHIFINIHTNFVSRHLSLYRFCSPLSLPPSLRCTHKQTYISIKPKLSMMNVVTF